MVKMVLSHRYCFVFPWLDAIRWRKGRRQELGIWPSDYKSKAYFSDNSFLFFDRKKGVNNLGRNVHMPTPYRRWEREDQLFS